MTKVTPARFMNPYMFSQMNQWPGKVKRKCKAHAQNKETTK